MSPPIASPAKAPAPRGHLGRGMVQYPERLVSGAVVGVARALAIETAPRGVLWAGWAAVLAAARPQPSERK